VGPSDGLDVEEPAEPLPPPVAVVVVVATAAAAAVAGVDVDGRGVRGVTATVVHSPSRSSVFL
jgi:hypothetical protein